MEVDMMVKVKYQLEQDFCSCCKRAYDKTEVSKEKEYELTDKAIEEYGDWKELFEFEEDQFDYVEEFITAELNFYLTGEARPTVTATEIQKVVHYIKEKYDL